MRKTTVYLPDELKASLVYTASLRGCSQAALIREGVALVLERLYSKPRLPLFSGGPPDLAERFDEYLDGFGED